MNTVKPIPDGCSVVMPRLICRDPVAEIEFCTKVLDAAELSRRPGADGKIAHALITIGPAMVMIESEWPALKNRAPQMGGSSPVPIFVYVENVDHAPHSAAAGNKQAPARSNVRDEISRSHLAVHGIPRVLLFASRRSAHHQRSCRHRYEALGRPAEEIHR